MRAKASVLVGLLWCLALLSVVVIGVLHAARIDLLVVKNHGDRIQARYLALAGIEKAKALLYQDARERSRSRVNHSGQLHDLPEQFRDVPFGRGVFRVFRRGRADDNGRIIYGVGDEESRLNLNVASPDELGRLKGMTPDVVAALNDWRDEDNAVSPGGAEADYYTSLQPPYRPRNGPLQTVRELLMVRGVTGELLGDASADTGWASILTVDSSVQNVNAAGQDRVNVQSADESALTSVRGITPDIAKAIVASRGQNRLETLADLLEVVAAPNPQQQSGPSTIQAGQGQSRQTAPPPNPSGPKVISEELLMDIGDDVTTDTNRKLPGVVNINTASLDVLACLPAIDREIAHAIISYRQSNGFFPNIAWLLKVPGMNRQIFKQVAPRVTTRSETYRILSEGKVNSSGARQRIQAIVHVDVTGVETLSYREDDL